MPTRKQPHKGGQIRSVPPTAHPSAPPKSTKGGRGETFTVPSAAKPMGGKLAATSAASASAMERAEALLREMTIEEKAMQLSSVFPVGLFGADGPLPSQLDEHLKHGIGHVAALGLIGHKTPEQMAKLLNAVQRYLVTQTRLKIPAIFHNEAMSGVGESRARRRDGSGVQGRSQGVPQVQLRGDVPRGGSAAGPAEGGGHRRRGHRIDSQTSRRTFQPRSPPPGMPTS